MLQKRSTLKIFLTAACFLAGVGPVNAQSSSGIARAGELPTADEVLQKSLNASGGRDAWLKLTSMRITADMSISPAGVTGTLEVLSKAPDKESDCVKFKNGFFLCHIYDGQSGWQDDSQNGLKQLQGKELEDLRRDADFYSSLHTRNNYSRMNVTREDEFDGLKVYVIEAVRNDGRRQELYYAKDLGFEVGHKDFYDPPEESRTFFLEDYQQVAGPAIKIPTKIRVISGSTAMRVVIQEIMPNAEIPASAFVKPEKSARDPEGAGKDDHPDNGRVTDGVYRNDFFGFAYTLPKGWAVHGAQTEKVLMETGKELLAGDSEERKKMMDAASKRTFHLLTAFEFPLGTPDKANRSIQLLAENVAFAPGIQDGKDYILNLKQVLSRGQLQMSYQGEPVEQSIDGTKFFRQNMSTKIGEIPIYEIVYSTKMNAYAICYVITARDKDGAEEVAQSILTFHRTHGEGPKP